MKYLVAIAVAATMLAVWLFPRALPVVVLSDRISREEALERSTAFVRAHDLPGGTRTAVRFNRGDSLITFVELAAGGKDSLDALVRGNDVAPYSWAVRHFTPRDVRETRVHFAPNGRLLGFTRRLAEADERPQLASDSAQRMAVRVLTGWLGELPDRWRLAATSYETRKTSGRVDRTFTFERSDRRIGGAPIRLDVVIAGDTPSAARRHVVVPEGFLRRYSEMRSANELYSLIADVGLLAIVVAGAVALRRFVRSRQLRWRAPLAVGGVIAILVVAAGLNEMSSLWYDYDTAMAPLLFQLTTLIAALAGGAVVGLLSAITLVVAEAATRAAFPAHLDWWGLWKHRGTREVAVRVLGGYTLAAVGLAYVVVFYLATRKLLGWWVPSELLDDPNLIATPAPWLAGIAMSVHAAVWEEAIFRALPLSLLSLWVGSRPRRALWMTAGVIATALVFGFAHANYPSWPAYSRGVEIFLDACLWGFVFLRFGLIVTVVAHFLYNATLFGLFAAGGSALPYRVTAAVVTLAILAPALAVAWKWLRQRGLTTAPAAARFGAWQAATLDAEQSITPEPAPARVLGARARTAAFAVIGAGALVALVAPDIQVRGAPYTVSRARVAAVADSIVAARGVNVAGWKRLIGTNADSLTAWPRFARHHNREEMVTALATTYAVPVWWEVRYVRTAGQLAERAEEWRVKVRPDGVPLELRHVVPDSAAGGKPDQPMARRIGRAALARAGLDTTVLVESKLEETVRPSRLDATVTYTDTTVRLPAGAAARASVSLAGLEPVSVRRHVELPEAFIREDRDQLMARGLMAALSGMALLTLIVVGSVRVIRRRPPLVAEAAPSRRVVVGAIVITGVLLLASALNDAPAMLLGYDTSESWS
ncbi:MAG: CPBP family intramembrane glutamic endopeptidase, partial [Gemmatimonadaceae bacterium]